MQAKRLLLYYNKRVIAQGIFLLSDKTRNSIILLRNNQSLVYTISFNILKWNSLVFVSNETKKNTKKTETDYFPINRVWFLVLNLLWSNFDVTLGKSISVSLDSLYTLSPRNNG